MDYLRAENQALSIPVVVKRLLCQSDHGLREDAGASIPDAKVNMPRKVWAVIAIFFVGMNDTSVSQFV